MAAEGHRLQVDDCAVTEIQHDSSVPTTPSVDLCGKNPLCGYGGSSLTNHRDPKPWRSFTASTVEVLVRCTFCSCEASAKWP